MVALFVASTDMQVKVTSCEAVRLLAKHRSNRRPGLNRKRECFTVGLHTKVSAGFSA